MASISKQMFFTFVSVLAVYALLLVVSLALYPLPNSTTPMNSARAGETVFSTDAKYVFLNRGPLTIQGPKVLLLGASNVQVGFQRGDLQQLLPGVAVHNLAVGASNITQDRQIFELARQVLPPGDIRKSVFVIGVWYGNMIPDQIIWNTPDRSAGDSNIDIERYRYGFATRSVSGPKDIVPPSMLYPGLIAIYPFVAMDRLARDVTFKLREWALGKVALLNKTEAERNAVVMSNRDKADAITYWRKQIVASTLGNQQFTELERTVGEITKSGAYVVVVNLPIPHWHSLGSSYYVEYAQRWDAFKARIKSRANVSVLDMGDMDDDSNFSDEVHPRPRFVHQWDRRLAAELNPLVTAKGAR